MNKPVYSWAWTLFVSMLPSLLYAQVNISGNLHTEVNDHVENVVVTLTGNSIATMTTLSDANGDYTFSNLPDNEEYKVCMDKDTDPLNGVSTFDLVLISKHILGTSTLNSPYKIIAADISNNRLVSVLDMLNLRQLILLITTDFSETSSWRFIPDSHAFITPTNPFADPFPERCTCVTTNGNVNNVNFTAIKTGDVNLSAVTN